MNSIKEWKTFSAWSSVTYCLHTLILSYGCFYYHQSNGLQHDENPVSPYDINQRAKYINKTVVLQLAFRRNEGPCGVLKCASFIGWLDWPGSMALWGTPLRKISYYHCILVSIPAFACPRLLLRISLYIKTPQNELIARYCVGSLRLSAAGQCQICSTSGVKSKIDSTYIDVSLDYDTESASTSLSLLLVLSM